VKTDLVKLYKTETVFHPYLSQDLLTITPIMNSLFSLILLLSSFGPLNNPSEDMEQVRRADENLNKFILKNDASSAAMFYLEDFVLTTSTWKQKSKFDILSEIASSDLKLLINITEDVEVRIAGQTAVLTGILHQQGSYKEKSFDVMLRVTDTWVKTETGWKILAGHASLISKN
jgi:ketosteroid isomerase-like protein